MLQPGTRRVTVLCADAKCRCGGNSDLGFQGGDKSGPILAVDAAHRLVHVENFNRDPASGPMIATDPVARGTGARMTGRMRPANTGPCANGMTDGLKAGFDNFAALLIAQ